MQSSSEHDAVRRPQQQRGISLQTLIIASVAATVTSYLVSRLWGRGTLVSAAATPVFVALVSELLRRPVQTVSATAKRVPVVQRVPPAHERTASPSDLTVVRGGPGLGSAAEAPTRAASAEAPTTVEPSGRPRRRAQAPPVVDPGYVAVLEAEEEEQVSRRPGPRWGRVLATGAIAFAIVVGVYTLPDLVAGHSITGNDSATTFFGGSTSSKPKPETKTVTEPAATTVTTVAPPTTTTTVPGEPTTSVPATAPAEVPPPPASSTTPAPTTPPATTTPPTTSGSSIPLLPGQP